ncbi:MAG TPA: DUF2949 domain-containing protein [Leptolyngbyaceae cyanobacterium M33_DOE_097]|nr:DUF2949 domain-containing protein [Leptolyngbyaceae cyanobacterium M33_DOE_097]
MDNSLSHIARFLRDELQIPDERIPSILQQCGATLHRLPVVLWQQRLMSLSQIDYLCEWLAQQTCESHYIKTSEVAIAPII